MKLLFYQCLSYLKLAHKFRKRAQPFMPVANPNWKEVKEWQPILCGTTWNILRASPHMLVSFYPQPECLSQMKALQVNLSGVTICKGSSPACTDHAHACIWKKKQWHGSVPACSNNLVLNIKPDLFLWYNFGLFLQLEDLSNPDEERVL